VIRTAAIVVLSLGAATAAESQSPAREREPRWTFGASVGGFLRGNSNAVRQWLRQNSYGASEPPACTFNPLLNRTCEASDPYPRISASSHVSEIGSIGLRLSDRVLIETSVASEQSGTALGHCDAAIVPKDARCTERFVELEFSGVSFGTLAMLELHRFHVGAGPAILLADWRMKPNNLPGVWMDAQYRIRSWPFFARIQYRYYRSTTLDGPVGFTRFHPSTLFVGAGFMTSTNNGY
jgi:hypothetical protein